MMISAYPHWIEVTREELDGFLLKENHLRDLYSGCDVYIHARSGERIAAHFLNGKSYIIPNKSFKKSIKP